MRWAELTAPGRGLDLHVRRVVEVSPSAEPVVLLHGLGVAGSVWQAFARRLVPHLAAIAPDLRGHGQSDAPPAGYLPVDYAADIAELIEHLPDLPVPVPVVGHSLGALVALTLADARPDLVRWVAVLDPPFDPDLPNTEVVHVAALRHAPPGELEKYLLSRNPAGGELLARVLATQFRQASDAAFDAMLDPSATTGRARTAAAQAWDSAGRVAQPTLVLQADPEHGGVLGDAAAAQLVLRLANARLVKIPGATHALHASHPAAVARALLNFAGYSSGVGSDSR